MTAIFARTPDKTAYPDDLMFDGGGSRGDAKIVHESLFRELNHAPLKADRAEIILAF